MSALAVARSVAILFTGLGAGALLGHRMGVSMARPRLDPGSFVQLQQIIHVYFSWMMPALMIVGLVATLAWASVIGRRGRAEWWCLMASALAMGSVVTLTVAINVPINGQLMSWTAAAPPSNLEQLWAPWETSHSVRTVLAVVAFALLVFAMSGREAPGPSGASR